MKIESLSLKGVVTRPDTVKGRGMKTQSSDVKSFAQELNLPCWTPKKSNDPEFLKAIMQKNCEFSFVCAYGQILPVNYLELFPKGSLNLHLSLLPKWRGAAPVQRALMAGDKKTGICLQIMTEALDAGDIIGQRSFEIEENDNASDIFNKALIKTESLLRKELKIYLKGRLKAQPQDHSKKTYARKIDKIEGKILWEESALDIHNKVRALFLGPQAFTFLKGQRVKVYQSKVLQRHFSDYLPGEICQLEKGQLTVACGRGGLVLLELQREGKKRQKIKDFLRGADLHLKDYFGK